MPTSITKSNFTQDKQIYTLWHADTGSTVQNQYVYMSCSSFDVWFTVTKNWGSWGRNTTITVWYYTGYEWIQAYQNTLSLGQFDSGNYERHFRHNWTGYNQDGDQPNYHLWCIRVSFPELYNKYFYCQPASYYYSKEDWTGQKIYGTADSYWHTGTSSDDAGAIAKFKTSSLRGTQIYSSSNQKSIFYTHDHNR